MLIQSALGGSHSSNFVKGVRRILEMNQTNYRNIENSELTGDLI
jgi:hypothetical protein